MQNLIHYSVLHYPKCEDYRSAGSNTVFFIYQPSLCGVLHILLVIKLTIPWEYTSLLKHNSLHTCQHAESIRTARCCSVEQNVLQTPDLFILARPSGFMMMSLCKCHKSQLDYLQPTADLK